MNIFRSVDNNNILDFFKGAKKEDKLEKKPIKNWNESDLLDFLNFICNMFSKKQFSLFKESFVKEIKKGKKLLELEEDSKLLLAFGEKDKRIFCTLLRFLKEKSENKQKFSKGFSLMVEKMSRSLDEEFDIDSLMQSAEFYSNEKLIKEEWLDMFEEPDEKVKIKIIVTDIPMNAKRRKFLAPVIYMFDGLHQKYGLFHTAISVGPFYLQWTNLEFIYEHEVKSSSAFLVLDCVNQVLTTDEAWEDIKEKLSYVIAKWNGSYRYSQMSETFGDNKKGNCQDFVKDVCSTLNIPFTPTGALKKYIDQINKKGEYKIEIALDLDFVNKFKVLEFISNNGYDFRKEGETYFLRFKTHRDIDDFAFHCYKINMNVREEYPNEFSLIKSFDRGFWLKHFQKPEEDIFKPAPIDESVGRKFLFGNVKQFATGCPFYNPKDTASFM